MARLIRAELPDPYQLVVRFRKGRDEPFLTWLLAQPVGQISELIRTRLNDLAARGELGGVTTAGEPGLQPGAARAAGRQRRPCYASSPCTRTPPAAPDAQRRRGHQGQPWMTSIGRRM